jgi:hypothetical protein
MNSRENQVKNFTPANLVDQTTGTSKISSKTAQAIFELFFRMWD